MPSNPFNPQYNPDKPGREHSCWGKISAIQERIGLILTHDEISFMCLYILHSTDPEDFYRKMDAMDDDELRKACEKAKLRKPKLTATESMLYA